MLSVGERAEGAALHECRCDVHRVGKGAVDGGEARQDGAVL